jgi:hypothetical protein
VRNTTEISKRDRNSIEDTEYKNIIYGETECSVQNVGTQNPSNAKFCNECGINLIETRHQ